MAIYKRQHMPFHIIAGFNLVIFLLFMTTMYSFITDRRKDASDWPVTFYGFMLLGFLAFGSYFYYQYLGEHAGNGQFVSHLAFLMNILLPLVAMLIYVVAVLR